MDHDVVGVRRLRGGRDVLEGAREESLEESGLGVDGLVVDERAAFCAGDRVLRADRRSRPLGRDRVGRPGERVEIFLLSDRQLPHPLWIASIVGSPPFSVPREGPPWIACPSGCESSDSGPRMDIDRLLPGLIGAFVGVVGWLLVGLFIQRRQFIRQARNAARAVYFELDVNRMNVEVARDYGSFTPPNRSSFERLLPELATHIGPGELRTILLPHNPPAGYPHGSTAFRLPPPVRRATPPAVPAAHVD